ncbi:hypothetical protein BDR04DRAFT_1161585 [Suillus decipiens]|nr:hypothetical protein BDR04DRAFT_1161585 [Suillus decipiens]
MRDEFEDIGQDPLFLWEHHISPRSSNLCLQRAFLSINSVLKLLWVCRWLRKSTNVVFESHHKTGSHFAPIERPEELVQNVRKMFAKRSPAFGIVPEELDMLHFYVYRRVRQ